jgi:hypothetical protein
MLLLLTAPPPPPVAVTPAMAPAVPDALVITPPFPAEPPFPLAIADPPAPPPPVGGTTLLAPPLPPWLAVEPAELPVVLPDDPWLQPIEDIRKTKLAPANNLDTVFNDSLVMQLPFVTC